MKKLTSLFLVFSILTLSGNLFAKEKKGADLIIQKIDGQQVRGELIAVKENSLLLLETDSGADVSVDIGDIGVITIIKKSRVGLGAGIGFLTGLGAGSVLVKATASDWDLPVGYMVLIAVGAGGVGALIGGLLGSISGKDETIQIEGKSNSEIQEIMEELRKKARIRNYQ